VKLQAAVVGVFLLAVVAGGAAESAWRLAAILLPTAAIALVVVIAALAPRRPVVGDARLCPRILEHTAPVAAAATSLAAVYGSALSVKHAGEARRARVLARFLLRRQPWLAGYVQESSHAQPEELTAIINAHRAPRQAPLPVPAGRPTELAGTLG
jgi:hypothetical protein